MSLASANCSACAPRCGYFRDGPHPGHLTLGIALIELQTATWGERQFSSATDGMAWTSVPAVAPLRDLKRDMPKLPEFPVIHKMWDNFTHKYLAID